MAAARSVGRKGGGGRGAAARRDALPGGALAAAVGAVLSAQAVKQAQYRSTAATPDVGARPGFFASGGMPSSHTAAMSALCVAVGRAEGFNSDLGALTIVLSTIVMYDAMNVRRAAGEQALVLNRLVKACAHTGSRDAGAGGGGVRGQEEDELQVLLQDVEELYPCRVCLGHTGGEVLGGLAWGALFGALWTGVGGIS